MNRRTVGPLALMIVTFTLSVLFVPRFGAGINIGYLLLQSTPLLLAAVGQTLVILVGGIDLSVGAVIAPKGVTHQGGCVRWLCISQPMRMASNRARPMAMVFGPAGL